MQRQRYVAIVEDDVSTREALARLLRVHGINSRSYPTARAFLKERPSNMPDCLIIDPNMPEMTGIELQRELLNLGVRIPIIVVTASDDESIASAASARRKRCRASASRISRSVRHACCRAASSSASLSRVFSCTSRISW